jgi:regulator of RNase E activity RraA
MVMHLDFVAKLGRFDTATICNVIELFEVRPRTEGYMDSNVRAAFPAMPAAVGVACTASFRSAAPSALTGYAGLDSLCALLENSPMPPLVVCQDLDIPPAGATVGDVMCSIYKSLGARALITSGAVRDLAQIGTLQFPIFAG